MSDNIRLEKDEAAFDYGIYVMTIYAVAVTNLYGLISLEELVEIANDYRVGAPPMDYVMYTKNSDCIRMPKDIKPDDVMRYLEMNAKTQNYVALIEYRGTHYLAFRDFIIVTEDGEESADWAEVESVL